MLNYQQATEVSGNNAEEVNEACFTTICANL